MKTRSLFTAVLAIAALLAACAPPLDNRGQGNIRISLSGGTPSVARALTDPPAVGGTPVGSPDGGAPTDSSLGGPPADLAYYQLEFSGPGWETLSRTLKTEDKTLTLSLALGEWTIAAKAFNTDNVPCGQGRAGFTVEAGRTQDVSITMTAVSGTPDIPVFSLPLASIDKVKDYLASVSGGGSDRDPVSLPAAFNLAANWTDLLGVIENAGKYVALDLAACDINGMTGTAGEFDPGTANTGKDKIVSLVLPGGATSIKATSSSSPPRFYYFSSLIGVRGENVTTIDDGAFRNCASLIMVDLPSITEIGYFAFAGCSGIRTVDFPAATDVRDGAFAGCSSLVTAFLPAVTEIGPFAFEGCTSLTWVDLSAVTGFMSDAGNSYAFKDTGTAPLTITLGDTAPSVGANTFFGVVGAVGDEKHVTVRVPSGAAGYGTLPGAYTGSDPSSNWGNGFRGKGWDSSSAYVPTGSVNESITLTIIETY